MKYYVYNKFSNNGILPKISEDIKLVEAVGLDYQKFFEELNQEDEVVFLGGDGTVNYLINNINVNELKNNVYLKANGTGNDFINDIEANVNDEILLNPYLKNLPSVNINGKNLFFINNVGFGIDGYCCEVADQMKAKEPNKVIDYSAIAIKGLLFHFKPCHASVTVDGKTYEYDNVWLAPTMKGRYYGGGMKVAPDQDRNSDKLSVVIYKSRFKLVALANFPSIFKGEHIKNKKLTTVLSGNDIHVKFSRPCAAQIDGETELNVTEYTAKL
ncbi:MAG: diacylglycerol kinase family protein [Erysipelotrichaceae bacterium]|nr:diacylglycerol kinase family protein [Erysipelotrichaceae bacterium]